MFGKVVRIVGLVLAILVLVMGVSAGEIDGMDPHPHLNDEKTEHNNPCYHPELLNLEPGQMACTHDQWVTMYLVQLHQEMPESNEESLADANAVTQIRIDQRDGVTEQNIYVVGGYSVENLDITEKVTVKYLETTCYAVRIGGKQVCVSEANYMCKGQAIGECPGFREDHTIYIEPANGPCALVNCEEVK